MSILNNPYSKMHLTFDPARFYGRRSEVASMVLGINADVPGSFLFIGAKLIGKTSLWKYLVHERGARQEFAPLWTRCEPAGPRRAVFAYLDFYRFPDGEDFLSFLFNQLMDNKAISAIVGEACAGMDGGAQGLGPVEALQALLDCLKRRDVLLVICLDHFDVVVQSMTQEQENTLAVLKELTPFIIMLENPPAELNPEVAAIETSPFFGAMRIYTLGPLRPDEARKLITQPLEESGEVFNEDEISFLLNQAGRHPYLLTLACEWLFEFYRGHPDVRVGRDERLDRQIAEELFAHESVKEVLSTFWKRLDDREREVLFKVAAADFGGMDKAREILARLKRHMWIERDFGQETYRFSAGLLREFVKQEQERSSDITSAVAYPDVYQIRDRLAPLDRRLFDYLYAHAGQVCTVDELYGVRGDGAKSQAALAAAISRIRDKIEDAMGPDREYIRNVRGQGYQLVGPPG